MHGSVSTCVANGEIDMVAAHQIRQVLLGGILDRDADAGEVALEPADRDRQGAGRGNGRTGDAHLAPRKDGEIARRILDPAQIGQDTLGDGQKILPRPRKPDTGC